MNRLILGDLVANARIWLGTVAVTIAGGLVAGLATGLVQTSFRAQGDWRTGLSATGGTVMTFALITVLSVVGAIASLAVSQQRRSYALWQLVGIRPVAVTWIVTAQLAVVGAVGGLVGAICSLPAFPAFYEIALEPLRSTPGTPPRAALDVIGLGIAAASIVLATMLGGRRGAKLAGRTAPIEALRDSDPARAGMTVGRIIWLVILGGGAIALAITLSPSWGAQAFGSSATWLSPLIVSAFAVAGPLLFPRVLRIWTAIVPRRVSASWFLARHSAHHRLARSAAAVGPLMVMIALIGGFYGMTATINAAGGLGDGDLKLNGVFLILGGPVLLSAVGAAAAVFMSGHSRERELALVLAAGSTRATVVRAALFEAIAYSVTATLLGVLAPLAGSAIIGWKLDLAVPVLPLAPLGAAAAFGAVLIVAATVAPTMLALRRPVMRTLAVE